ncbi:MAG: type II/IV secretion system protein [Sulfurospirillum sp.]|nr:type II/IV secretion system protein [Sulfurospirillum sp.]MBL0703091.1 type II/IV secretion system protein [Sulfurospirillum sp.]
MSKTISNILNYLLQNRRLETSNINYISKELEQSQKTLGDILIQNSFFSQENMLILVIELYKKGYLVIEEINNNFPIELEFFLKKLAKNLKLEYVDLDSIDVNYKMSVKIPFNKLKKFNALPFKEDEINVYVALKDPMNMNIQEGVQRIFSKRVVKFVISQPMQIEKYIKKVEMSESIKDLVDEIRKEITSSIAKNSQESSSILKLINMILETAILADASDIHIEPTVNNCTVRARIDGMLNEAFIFDEDIYPPLASRIKLLSNMDIAEKRKPQDGRFSTNILGREFDFRISTLPVLNGESIVMRILDKSKVMIKIEDLGMHVKNYKKFSKAMKTPYGIIFVTGPTGSGKTTTLYGALNAIKNIQNKIITVEDPVEYQLSLTQQVQVNQKSGLTFANALKSILRQDPDIIMIGEVRDQETLKIAVQAALTGHLVFSTLHTNDSISAIARVMDMGIEPYLLSGSLIAIEAQRLVRKLCLNCRTKTTPPKSILNGIEKYLPKKFQFYKHNGCDKCTQTGYKGREMLSEILLVSEKISSMIAQGNSKKTIHDQAINEGFIDMFQDGVLRAGQGITTLDEIIRVVKS